MPSLYFFPGYLAFVLWGPIMPPGCDEEHKCHVFFTTEQSKDKKKDGRKSIRTEQVEEENRSRTGTSVSEGRGLTNKEHLFAASNINRHSRRCSKMPATRKHVFSFLVSVSSK